MASIIITIAYQRIRMDKVLLLWVGGIIASVLLFAWFIDGLPSKAAAGSPTLFAKETFTNVLGNLILFLIVASFLIGGWVKKINVFEAFI
ncbi:hypothetical protein ABTK28_20285, partial [Acinetobacter baumannii]